MHVIVGDRMKYLKIAGIGWGLVYFAMGALKSFTLNANDTWASVVLLFALFLLPLPIAILAIWLPRAAGGLLLGCLATNAVAVASIVISRRTYPWSDMIQFFVFMVLYHILHLFFSITYIKVGQAREEAA